MSWITVDTKLGNHPKMAALPSDAARYGWVMTLLEAKEQRHQGTFASENHYRLVMGRHGRFLPDYIKAGLIDKDEDGSVHVHDWKQHQWSVAKAKQRGQVEDIDETSEGQKVDASRAVSVPVYVEEEVWEGVQGEPTAIEAYYQRTGEVPRGKIHGWLNDLANDHGEARVARMILATPKTGDHPTPYLRDIQSRLRIEDVQAEQAERQDEKRRNAAKRAPLQALPLAQDVSEDEARRLAEEYTAQARAGR